MDRRWGGDRLIDVRITATMVMTIAWLYRCCVRRWWNAGGGVFGAAVSGGGSSRALEDLPPPREVGDSLDEVDVPLRAGSGIGTPSGDVLELRRRSQMGTSAL